MDQLKPALEFLKQYGFWIAVSVILLGAVGVWHTVTSGLVAENESRAGRIRGDVSTVTRIRSELAEHPNPTSHEKMEEMIEGRETEVLKAWQTRFDAQRDILVWPEKELTKELIDEYRDLIPIEQYVSFPTLPEQEVETELRNQYRYYIERVLAGIAEIAKAEWTASFDSAGGGMAGGMAMGMDMGMGMDSGMGMPATNQKIDITGASSGPLVKWPVGAQQSLISELFPWKGTRPSTLDVYYSQENLWILRQLLAIIADVNGKARQPFEAKIRQINRLSMGSKVRFAAGSIAAPGVQSMGGEMGMGMDMGMGSDMGMDMGMDMDMGMSGGMGMADVDPADGRYVDTLFEPITGAQLRGALDSESPGDAPLKVAKRVPVMMSLQIDQRAVPELLAACGSAPLMVQVKQTRILPLSGASAANSGMESGMGMGMESGMGMDSGMGMGGGAAMMSGGGSDQFPLDVTVEVYGLIHIYNPPQKEKLGVDQITSETIIDGETMAEKIEAEKANADIAAPDAALPAPPAAAPPAAAPPAAAPPAATPPSPAGTAPAVLDGPAAVPGGVPAPEAGDIPATDTPPAPAAAGPAPGLSDGAGWLNWQTHCIVT